MRCLFLPLQHHNFTLPILCRLHNKESSMLSFIFIKINPLFFWTIFYLFLLTFLWTLSIMIVCMYRRLSTYHHVHYEITCLQVEDFNDLRNKKWKWYKEHILLLNKIDNSLRESCSWGPPGTYLYGRILNLLIHTITIASALSPFQCVCVCVCTL